jgi:hypothetical protein
MSHPDFFEGLMDWPVYGPRDSRIADRVEELAAMGQRLVEIEDVILAALDARLVAVRNPPTSS